jgi:hypothetical protein
LASIFPFFLEKPAENNFRKNNNIGFKVVMPCFTVSQSCLFLFFSYFLLNIFLFFFHISSLVFYLNTLALEQLCEWLQGYPFK